MTKVIVYKLPCECGLNVQVSRSQAGQEVVCACGAKLIVPTLRGLNGLETADSNHREAHLDRREDWTLGRGLAAALLLAVGVLGAAADGYYIYMRSFFHTSYTKEKFLSEVDNYMSNLGPGDAWQAWNELVDKGFGPKQMDPYFQNVKMARRMEFRIGICSILSLIGFIGAAVVAFWPRKKPGAALDGAQPPA